MQPGAAAPRNVSDSHVLRAWGPGTYSPPPVRAQERLLNIDIRALNELVREESAFVDLLTAEVGKVIVGQPYMIERMLDRPAHRRPRAARGRARPGQDAHRPHALPTASARSSRASSSRRTCCRPTSSARMIYNQQTGEFTVRSTGPSSPTSSSPTRSTAPRPRCRARCSRRCRSGRSPSATRRYPLPSPFLVLATQNPIEQEGTYPLPEAQVDRFMLKVKVGYPTREEEREILDRMAGTEPPPTATPVVDAERDLSRRARSSTQIYVDDKVKDYIVDVVFATREPEALRAAGARRRSSSSARRRARRIASTLGRAGPRLPAPPRLRHARGRQGDRPGRAAPPRGAHLRGRGRGA